MRNEGALDRNLGLLARALKKGGVLAIEQHRGTPGPQDPKAANGYVTEAFVIEAAQKVGLKLDGRSEINANARDTKDHPFGVWTLPPTRSTVPYGSGKPADPAFDRSKYDAIGESDRMTLRFVRSAD
jgi:predicted methyltransferase